MKHGSWDEFMTGTEIFYNRPALEIVTSPFLVGKELEEKACLASVEYLRYFKEKGPRLRDAVELVILDGGYYYHLADAYEEVYDREMKQLSVKCRRFFDREWKTRMSFHNLHGLEEGNTILIGDTVATGVTLKSVISRLVQHSVDENIALGDVIVFTIAGSKFAASQLEYLGQKLEYAGSSLSIHYANAAFGLAENGTDLLFDDAEYDSKALAGIEEKIPGFKEKMKCAIWDWGERFTAPEKHLEEAYGYYKKIGAPSYIIEGFEKGMKEGFEEATRVPRELMG